MATLRWTTILGICVLLCSPATAETGPDRGRHKVGFTELKFHDRERQRPLDTVLWYPATAETEQSPVAYAHAFKGFAAKDAEYHDTGDARPLVLMSHGDRGMHVNLSWLAELLASHGYIVASANHWLNTARHYEVEETIRIWHRPKDISVLLDKLLARPHWRARIDATKIIAFGHSSGGYTAIALAGARFNAQKLQAYCRSPLRGRDCDLVKGADFDAIDYSRAGSSYEDDRVRAAIALTPAVGQGIEEDSLRSIEIPVYIVTTEDDTVLKPSLNALRYHDYIPTSELTTLKAGGHFIYLSECTLITRIFTRFNDFDICSAKTEADKEAIHGSLGKNVLAFLQRHKLGPASNPPSF